MGMFLFSNTFYVITIILQGICVYHCIRKGNQQNWIWLIVFLPLIGCVIYFFSEILNRGQIQSVSSGVSEIIRPSGSVRKLEENLRFSDTFNNRIALADAYLANGQQRPAIELYESSLTGAFAENEHGIAQLALAWYREKNYEEVLKLVKKIRHLPQFQGSKTHILYAMSLGYAGHTSQAEEEFLKQKGRFSNFEARYYYSLFLQQNNRTREARQLLSDMITEVPQLSSVERRHHREWIGLAKEALKKIP
jgi:hypothetical protein